MQHVRDGMLKNGLRFYTHYDRVAHVGGIGVKHGSIHDPPGKRGMAHFIEHVATRRTRELSERDVELLFWKYMGGLDKDRKVQTDRVSVFYGNDTLLREHYMMQCFAVYASMLSDPILDPTAALSEMAAVRQEYFLRGVDWLPSLVDDLVHETMYERNPARNRVDCDPEELLQISVEDMLEEIKKYYGPNNLFIVLLGPSHEKAKSLAEKYFGELPPRPVPELQYDRSEDVPVLSSVKSIVVPRAGIGQHHVAIGFPTETYATKDAETIDVLAQILNFRLYFRLRNENRDPMKGVYRVEVFTPRTFVHGMLYVYFATGDQSFADEGKKMVFEELEKLKREKVTDQELVAIKSRLDSEYLEAFRDTPGDLADMIIDAVCNGDEELVGMRSYRTRLRRVSRRKILQIANKYFSQNHAEVVVTPT